MITKQYKKWLLSAAALLAGAACAEAQVTESAEYLLKLQDSNLYLSAETAKAGESSELSLNGVCEPGFVQTVVFTQATGGYNLTFGQQFAAVRDQWYMRYKNTSGVNLSSADAIFAVEASGDGIMLKNLGSASTLGAIIAGTAQKCTATRRATPFACSYSNLLRRFTVRYWDKRLRTPARYFPAPRKAPR